MDEPSHQLGLQMNRNRIIGVLELICDPQIQRRYQREVPYISVPNEMVNQWEDYYTHDPARLQSPVFTDEEREAVVRFDAAFERFCSETPDTLPDLEELLQMREMADYMAAAAAALAVFRVRGRFSEDVELDFSRPIHKAEEGRADHD